MYLSINFCRISFQFNPSQGTIRCSPKGRDCIENNFAETFDCNVTCKGIYADVHWTDEPLSIDGKATSIWKRNKAKGIENMQMLIAQYNAFKKNNVKHFRFNSTLSNSVYGEVMLHKFVFFVTS